MAGCRPIFSALLWENEVMEVPLYFHKMVSYNLNFISWRNRKNLYINYFTIAHFLKKIYISIISKCKHSLNTCLTVRIDPAIVSLRLAVSFFEALFLFHSLVFFIISLKLFILIKYTWFYTSLIDYQSFLRELCDRVTGGIHRRWYGETTSVLSAIGKKWRKKYSRILF